MWTECKLWTKCGGFKNNVFFYCTEWVKFLNSQRIDPKHAVLSYIIGLQLPCWVTLQQWKQLICLTDTTPQKLISLLPQYYHILYNMSWTGPSLAEEARLLISLATTSDFCSSHILIQRGATTLRPWKINWRLLSSGFSWNSWNKLKQSLRSRLISSRTNCQRQSVLFQTVIGLVPSVPWTYIQYKSPFCLSYSRSLWNASHQSFSERWVLCRTV